MLGRSGLLPAELTRNEGKFGLHRGTLREGQDGAVALLAAVGQRFPVDRRPRLRSLANHDLPAHWDRIDVPCELDRPINGQSFTNYLEQFLVPNGKAARTSELGSIYRP